MPRPFQALDRGLFKRTFLIGHLRIDLDEPGIRLQHRRQGCLEQNDIALRRQPLKKRFQAPGQRLSWIRQADPSWPDQLVSGISITIGGVAKTRHEQITAREQQQADTPLRHQAEMGLRIRFIHQLLIQGSRLTHSAHHWSRHDRMCFGKCYAVFRSLRRHLMGRPTFTLGKVVTLPA